MTGPREWRHAATCTMAHAWHGAPPDAPCNCGLSAVRDAIAAGHRVVIGPDGVEGRVDLDSTSGCPGDCAHYRLVPIEEATDAD